jgi:hypothetical protein
MRETNGIEKSREKYLQGTKTSKVRSEKKIEYREREK